jgi:hypothetical protein
VLPSVLVSRLCEVHLIGIHRLHTEADLSCSIFFRLAASFLTVLQLLRLLTLVVSSSLKDVFVIEWRRVYYDIYVVNFSERLVRH